MSNHGVGDIDGLFRAARADGLADGTIGLVVSNLNGPTLMQPIGVSLHDLSRNDVTLVMNIIDMSGSMSPHADTVVDAYNSDYLGALAGSAGADGILVSTVLFNERVVLLHGYVNLGDVPVLTAGNYNPAGTTALYDAVAGGVTNMVLYAQQLRQNGVMARCLLIVYSDGQDNASRQSAHAVRRAAVELLQQELYTLAYVAFHGGDKSEIELRKLAEAIGFPHLLSATLNAAELRRIFQMASRSAVSVSRGAAYGAGII